MDWNVHAISVELSIVRTPLPLHDAPVTPKSLRELDLQMGNPPVPSGIVNIPQSRFPVAKSEQVFSETGLALGPLPAVVAQTELVPPAVQGLPVDLHVDGLSDRVVPNDQAALVRTPDFMLSRPCLGDWIAAEAARVYVGIGYLCICIFEKLVLL